ncbi:MAG: Tim44 domain-containing protein [Magnetococcales bacterium]|nr:Tim44 domain-containing protein [Magnetococcales bacterium]
MKNRHPIFLFFLFMLGLAIAIPVLEAEAARAGGGGSVGSRGSRSFNTPREAPQQRSDLSQSATQATRPAGGGFASGLMGGLAGFALGGLIGSLLFGGEGGGFGLLEMLLIGGVIWFLYKRFSGRRAPAPQFPTMPTPQPAMEGPISLRKVSLDKTPPQTGTSQFQGQGMPNAFSFGATQDEVSQGLAEILRMDPNFNEAHFLGGAKGAFQQIQSAWSDWSVDRLRPLLTERMWSIFEQQARARQTAGRRDILEKIRFLTAELSEVWQEAGEHWITVHFVVEMVEYETDVAGRVLSGDPNRPVQVEEYWTFCRPMDSSNPNWYLSAIQQPGEVARSVP